MSPKGKVLFSQLSLSIWRASYANQRFKDTAGACVCLWMYACNCVWCVRSLFVMLMQTHKAFTSSFLYSVSFMDYFGHYAQLKKKVLSTLS